MSIFAKILWHIEGKPKLVILRGKDDITVWVRVGGMSKYLFAIPEFERREIEGWEIFSL